MHNLSPVITPPPNFRYPAYVPGHRAYIFICCVGWFQKRNSLHKYETFSLLCVIKPASFSILLCFAGCFHFWDTLHLGRKPCGYMMAGLYFPLGSNYDPGINKGSISLNGHAAQCRTLVALSQKRIHHKHNLLMCSYVYLHVLVYSYVYSFVLVYTHEQSTNHISLIKQA